MPAVMPWLPILIALKDGLAAALTGMTINDRPLLVRHHRHREAKSTERHALSVRYVSADISQQYGRGETDANMPEDVMELAVDLVIDMDVAPEADRMSTEDPDPTGFAGHAQVMAAALNWLIPGDDAEPNNLGGLVWDIRYDGTSPDEDEATSDAARMEERLVLLYRVRRDQPTILLTGS